jgi:hypothetical protein
MSLAMAFEGLSGSWHCPRLAAAPARLLDNPEECFTKALATVPHHHLPKDVRRAFARTKA